MLGRQLGFFFRGAFLVCCGTGLLILAGAPGRWLGSRQLHASAWRFAEVARPGRAWRREADVCLRSHAADRVQCRSLKIELPPLEISRHATASNLQVVSVVYSVLVHIQQRSTTCVAFHDGSGLAVPGLHLVRRRELCLRVVVQPALPQPRWRSPWNPSRDHQKKGRWACLDFLPIPQSHLTAPGAPLEWTLFSLFQDPIRLFS